jgi:hypothetical protein
MKEKPTSATQRVLKSIVGPALRTSLAALLTTACTVEKPIPNSPTTVTPTTKPQASPEIVKVGTVVAASQPASTPAQSQPTSQAIPDPGKILPAGKIAPAGKIPPPGKPPIKKVGKTLQPVGKMLPQSDGVKVGIHMDPERKESERPTRLQRRSTDSEGGVFRTGFVGGRKLS